ncbi:MAG: 5-oxoprolinase subunit PxpA [Nocardioidaceae bacterium]
MPAAGTGNRPTEVDLNADLAEGYGRWTFGTDADLLTVVSSANVACGFHAGDPSTIRSALAVAAANEVTVGAHVGYPDLQGFGRRPMDLGDELVDIVVYQIAALVELARIEGTAVRYVKPHGALYNRAAVDEHQATSIVTATTAVDPSLAIMCQTGSVLHRVATDAGLTTVGEVFADRAYLADGRLVPRSTAGSVVTDPDLVVERVLRMVIDREVVAIDGTVVEIDVASICVHGDSPDAVVLARRVASALRRAKVVLRSPLALR